VVILTDKYAVMTWAQLCAVERDDAKLYGWGHGGPCYYRNRIVIVVETLGL